VGHRRAHAEERPGVLVAPLVVDASFYQVALELVAALSAFNRSVLSLARPAGSTPADAEV
jgi:hypothetical protein